MAVHSFLVYYIVKNDEDSIFEFFKLRRNLWPTLHIQTQTIIDKFNKPKSRSTFVKRLCSP
jgi:hypothetical protein